MLHNQLTLSNLLRVLYSTLVLMTTSCRQPDDNPCTGEQEAFYATYDNQYTKYMSVYGTGDILHCKHYTNNILTDSQLVTCLGLTDQRTTAIEGNYPCSYQKKYTDTRTLSFSGDTSPAIVLTPRGMIFYSKGYTFYAHPNYIDNINYSNFQDSLITQGITYYHVNLFSDSSGMAYLIYSTQYGFLMLVKNDEYWIYTK